MDVIPVAGPWITQREIDKVGDAVANAWYGKANIYNERFEEAFAEYLGVRYAVSLPSCTSAIHLSLLALGVERGDEVIVPDVTWIASAAPINYVGATPVFADIDPRTWCLSAHAIEECITPRTKAVIAVDLYGGMPDMDAIRDITQRHKVALVEDAAEAIGSEWKSRKAGSFGETGTFSFHGTKTLTTGEGGMLVTDREDVYRRVLFLRDHGCNPGDKTFESEEVAFKYKMSSLQAALGLAQLERIEELVGRKRRIFDAYRQELAGVEGVTLNYEPPGTGNSYWMVTAVLDREVGITKKELIPLMQQRNIVCRPFFSPLSSLPAYEKQEQAKRARQRNQVSFQISPYGVNLPSAMTLTQQQIEQVSSALKSILGT